MACNGMTYSSNNSCGCGCGFVGNNCLWTIIVIAVIVLWLGGSWGNGCGCMNGCSEC